MTTGNRILVAAAGVLIGLGAGTTKYVLDHRTPAYTCVAGPDEQCASDEFVKEWKEYQAIADKYTPTKEDSIKLKGMLADLQPQLPPGYSWDPKKLRFVKQKTAGPIIPQAPPK